MDRLKGLSSVLHNVMYNYHYHSNEVVLTIYNSFIQGGQVYDLNNLMDGCMIEFNITFALSNVLRTLLSQ